MEAPELRRAVEAGRTTAAASELQVDDVVVVHNSDRVALRLLPCDVLVRVAPSADRVASEFEVEVARRLADVDGPVGALDPRVEPRVHLRAGFAISLWTYYEPAGAEIAPADYAAALAQVHTAFRKVDLAAPRFTERVAGALAALDDHGQTPELHDRDRELLVGSLSGLSAAMGDGSGTEQLLHGEPHQGNLLATRLGPLFIDLATCCRGPVEFDLAHAPEDVTAHYPGADVDLVHRCRVLNWAMFTTWRFRHDDQFPGRAGWRSDGLANVRAALERA